MRAGLFQILEKHAADIGAHREFLDDHFSSPTRGSWDAFKKNLRSPAFLGEVQQDPRSDKKLKRFSEAISTHLRAKGVPTFPVPSQSSGEAYTVKYHPSQDRFSCNCGDWVHARSWRTGKKTRDCKHVRMVQLELRAQGKTAPEFQKEAALRGLVAARLAELLGDS